MILRIKKRFLFKYDYLWRNLPQLKKNIYIYEIVQLATVLHFNNVKYMTYIHLIHNQLDEESYEILNYRSTYLDCLE